MKRNTLSRRGVAAWAAGLALAVCFAVTLSGAAPEAGPEGTSLNAATLAAVRVAGGFEVRCEVVNPLTSTVPKQLTVSIADLDGKVSLQGQSALSLTPGVNKCVVRLPGEVPSDKIPLSMLRYELSGGGRSQQGARCLVDALPQLETRVVAYRDLIAGSKAGLRLVAFNHAGSTPVQGAAVTIKLAAGGTDHVLYTGTTGADGSIDAQFDVPGDAPGAGELRIAVAAAGLGEDQITQPVTVQRKSKILLTTDKPLYQPGQRIRIRALSLRAADLAPEAKQALVFEVMDSKGNKVFKHKTDTDEFGVASADFQLASEVNLGSYIVRAVLDQTTSEKQVTVDRYVLPKFKVEAKTDKDYYLPGETVKGEIQSDYFFGKPVAAGKVHITASKFEIQFEKFGELDGQLDDKGHWAFELPLPAYFAGTPIEQGKASVRLEVEVTDTADHQEDKVLMKPVAPAALSIFAVPESGALVPRLENRVFVLVSYPDGSPASAARLTVSGPGVDAAKAELDADALGIATALLTPAEAGNMTLLIKARDSRGNTAEKSIPLSSKALAESLILRTDKTLYSVGDTLHAEALSTKQKGTVYFDLIRQGQTAMTRTAELENGKASLVLDMDAGLAGSVALQAYVFTPGTDLVRDTRLLYVNPADALTVGVEMDRDTHKPGENAQVHFRITDKGGQPTAAALGIAIVDESVFALQEIHPGLEKVYFTLEQEIMKPRYEIHGYELDKLVVGPQPLDGGGAPQPLRWSDMQQKAATVLLASAPEPPLPPVRVNTFEQKRKGVDEAIQAKYMKDLEHIQKAIARLMEKTQGKASSDIVKTLLREKFLRPAELIDPWGKPYEFDFTHFEDWRGYFTMLSCGPDGVKGTEDDLAPDSAWGRRLGIAEAGGIGMKQDKVMRKGVAMPMALAAPAPAAAAEKPKRAEALDEKSIVPAGSIAGEAVAASVRIREYFPETLLFEPALITDAQGAATLDVDLADSITTWRMTAMASSRGGALGSKEAPLRVFQDFFVDLDLPVALTQHDRISIPVVAYNYLPEAQDIQLKFEAEPWFKLDGPAEQTLRLEPGAVRSIYFPIEVVELGKHKLTVTATGSKMSDAIRREIEVLPDGEEQTVAFSDRLSGRVEHTVDIPANAVAGASKILVRIYPGVFSQIVDGLDSMLQMPSGCFEQTSSSTYPNILIVQYLKETKQINPEVQMKAEGFINAGYQRLLSYEVAGGGFSWFGDAPANKVLTAWGLKEFFDMSKVHEVDPAVIERTRAWLLSQQEPDGSWKADANYLHAESWGNIQNSQVLVTAYILDAVAGAGGSGPQVQKAVDYVKANWQKGEGAYTLALVANALVSVDRNNAATQQVLTKLYDLREEDKDTAHWKGGSGTVTFTHGDAADIEATALATIAFLNSGKYPETTTKALTYLIRKKGAQGHWGSTQATILALKALTLSLGSRTEQVNATVTVAVNGEQTNEIKIVPDDSDVMRLVDLGEKTKSGANAVTLSFTGEGSMLYQIVGRYYTPWAQREKPVEPMTIGVTYDKTQLAVNDLVTVAVKVTNNRPTAAQMTIVDLGIPPGFEVVAADLEALVKQETIEKYELTGRQIITYFERIEGNAAVEFSYKLRAKFPLRAQTPQSSVYEYYNRDVRAAAVPQELVVE